ncbi:MAG: AraC family transcriptional regulator ligand-binding domain-containing protein [Sphingomonadales bacterium]
MNRIPLIRAGFTNAIKTDIEDFDLPVEPLFEKAKLPINCYDYPEALIPLESSLKLYELAAKKIGDSSLGLKIGNKMKFEDLGEFGKLFSTCSNLEALINKFEQYSPTYSNGMRIWHTLRGDNVHWFFSLNPDIKDHRRQHTELAIAFMQNIIKMAAGENWNAMEVDFEHISLGKKRSLENVFQTSLKFSKNYNRLIFSKRILCLPIKENSSPEKNKNSDLFETAPYGTFAPVLKQILKPLALEGRPKISKISTMMGLGPRTIQRLLAKEGTNFRTLVDQVCFERSADLLARDNKNLLQVALMQGYSEGASFSRAFKRWAGVTPSEYRSLSFEEEFQNFGTGRDF